MTTLLIYPITGIAAGFLAGMLGIGGGLIVVPMLFYVFGSDPVTAPYAMHMALGTSLAFIVFNSGIAAFSHHRLGGVHWDETAWLAPGLAIGGLIGAAIADHLSRETLTIWFGGFLLVMAAYIFLQRRPVAHAKGKPWISLIAGVPIGSIASLAGVGGGVMVVPWLMARGYPPARAVGTSSVCTVVVAVLGSIGYIMFADTPEYAGATGYVYWPAVAGIAVTSVLTAPLGARAAHRVNQKLLRRGFAMLLLVIGLKLIF